MSTKPWLKGYDPDVPATLVYPSISLTDLFTQSVLRFPDQNCTIFRDQSITYQEMGKLTARFAAGLYALGVQKGDRVGLLLPNIPQFVLAFYGILQSGGVVVAMNPQFKARELEYQIRDSGLSVLIALGSQRDLVEDLRQRASLRSVIYTQVEDTFDLVDSLHAEPRAGENCLAAGYDCWLTSLLSQAQNFEQPQITLDPADEAIFQYSGGTTGTPKAAVGLHRNLVANTFQFRHWLVGMQDGKEVVLAAIPLFHVYGMVIAMSVGIGLGASLVLVQNPRNVDDILDQIQKYRATLFPGVPNLYQAINNHPTVLTGKVDLSSIKACISGSAPLLLETKERFEALTGGKLMEGYGLSEAPTATHCNPMFGENRSGSIGLPLPDVDCKIVDLEDGKTEKQPRQIGELVIRGPQVMKGYHKRPEEDRVTLVDGWLYTGDIAWMDENGYFYLVDRKKELIKIGGFQVWPREIEEVIALHPKVKEVAASGVPDPIRVEIIKVWVVPLTGETLSADEIRIWCGQHLARYKVPSLVEFLDTLPRTTVGKVLRRELKQQYIDQQLL